MKQCTRCGESRSVEDFGPHKKMNDGLQAWCRECMREYSRDNYHTGRLRRFGITQERYDQMLEDQDNRCAICKRTETAKAWAIDHDHSCCPGQSSCGECVRGLLCSNCNTAIGLLGDSVDSLRSAITYLTQPK